MILSYRKLYWFSIELCQDFKLLLMLH